MKQTNETLMQLPPERRSTWRQRLQRRLGYAGVTASIDRGESTPFHEALLADSAELTIGTERANAVIEALNNASGAVTREQYLPKTVDTVRDSETVAAFVHDSAQARSYPEQSPERRRLYEVPIRVDKIVSAAGIDNFVDGRTRGDTKEVYEDGQRVRRKSSQIIKKYAERSSATAPPIRGVTAYLQPNGETYFSVYEDGAHRVAAAKLRGDEYIQAYSVSIVKLDDNRISENIVHR